MHLPTATLCICGTRRPRSTGRMTRVSDRTGPALGKGSMRRFGCHVQARGLRKALQRLPNIDNRLEVIGHRVHLDHTGAERREVGLQELDVVERTPLAPSQRLRSSSLGIAPAPLHALVSTPTVPGIDPALDEPLGLGDARSLGVALIRPPHRRLIVASALMSATQA